MGTTIEVERLAGSCGAMVRALDLSTPQTPEQVESILQLLDEHLVVAFPGQQFDLDRLEAFTDELGGRDVTPYVDSVYTTGIERTDAADTASLPARLTAHGTLPQERARPVPAYGWSLWRSRTT